MTLPKPATDADRAATEPVGVILLTGFVVLAATLFGVYYLGSLEDRAGGPVSDVEADLTRERVTFTHVGGDALDATDLVVVVRVDGSERDVAWADGSVDGDGDDRFEAGERWVWTGLSADADAAVSVALAYRGTGGGQVLAEAELAPAP